MKKWHISPLIVASSDFQLDLFLHFLQSLDNLPATGVLTASLLRQTISSPCPSSLGKLPSTLPGDKFCLNTRLFKKPNQTKEKRQTKTQLQQFYMGWAVSPLPSHALRWSREGKASQPMVTAWESQWRSQKVDQGVGPITLSSSHQQMKERSCHMV